MALHLKRAAVRSVDGQAGRELLSLAIPNGGLHVLLGEAGSDKSAVLEMIALARPPARGGMELFGVDVGSVRPRDRYRLRRRIGVVLQDLRLVDDLSLFDNLALAIAAAGGDPVNRAADITEALAWVGLERGAKATAESLRPEGRRRLALARAVINRPDLVIADEPAGAGDSAVLKLLLDLHKAGSALLVATRDTAFAESCGGEISWLSAPGAGPLDAAALGANP